MAFYEIRFPVCISAGSAGGPKWKTDVVTVDSGYEYRNQTWADARHEYDASFGVKSIEDLRELLAFFHEVRGRAHGFRYKDFLDYQATDEVLEVDSSEDLQLVKTYDSSGGLPYTRIITKPVEGTVVVRRNGVVFSDYTLDYTTGLLTPDAASDTDPGDVFTWSGEFDVPCRFDTDSLSVVLDSYKHGQTSAPVIEVRV